MNQKIRMKRITAWLLVVCMVMLNSPLAAMKARAEGEATEDITKLDYTIKVTVEVGKTSYNVPMDYIKSVTTDDGKTAIQKTGNAYKLEPKKKYKCKIEGLEMNEHEVGFETPETAGEVMIKSDPAKIKIYFGDLSDFKVGDEAVATKNLDIAWTWEVDKSDVLSVTKDGKIKGLKNGTATVKRTFLQNGTAFSNEVTVHVIGESQYTLNYKYKDEMIGEDSDIQITIEDKNNTKIEPNGGKYTLVWGEKYTYNITDSKGVKNPEGSREFTPDRNETSVIIPIDLDLPIFQLEGIDITTF